MNTVEPVTLPGRTDSSSLLTDIVTSSHIHKPEPVVIWSTANKYHASSKAKTANQKYCLSSERCISTCIWRNMKQLILNYFITLAKRSVKCKGICNLMFPHRTEPQTNLSCLVMLIQLHLRERR